MKNVIFTCNGVELSPAEVAVLFPPRQVNFNNLQNKPTKSSRKPSYCEAMREMYPDNPND